MVALERLSRSLSFLLCHQAEDIPLLSFDDRGFVYLRELAERVQDCFPDVREEELLEVLRTRTKNALSCGKERSGQLMAIPSQWILRTKW